MLAQRRWGDLCGPSRKLLPTSSHTPRRGAENWKNRADYLCLTFQGGLGQDCGLRLQLPCSAPFSLGVVRWSVAGTLPSCAGLCGSVGVSLWLQGAVPRLWLGGGREGRGWVGDWAKLRLSLGRTEHHAALHGRTLPGWMPTAWGPWMSWVTHISQGRQSRAKVTGDHPQAASCKGTAKGTGGPGDSTGGPPESG